MREFLKILASLCAVLFIFAAVTVLLLFNVERKAFTSATYKQAFEDQRLYERMPALLASALQVSVSQNPAAFPFLRELSTEEWQSTISSMLPPEELRAVADSALDSTFDFLNNKTDAIVLSLLPVKTRLAGESGLNVIEQFLSTQPACTLEQLAQMGLGLLGGNIALCNPPPEAMGLVEPLIQSQLQTIVAAFPNEVTLTASTDRTDPADPRFKLHMVRSAIRFSPFVLILLLLAIALFAIRGFRDLLVWWGWPFLIVGSISVIIGLIASPLISGMLQFLIQAQGAAFLPPLLASSIAETASAVARQILIPVTIQGLVFAIIGVLMVGLSLFIRRKPESM